MLAKGYWFFIETYVHIALKGDSLLLYNTLTGKTLMFSGERNGKIITLVKRMKSPGNLLVIRLTGDELEDPVISEFVGSVRALFMGDLIDTSYSEGKPIQMQPVVSVDDDIQMQRNNPFGPEIKNVLENLVEIFLYINNTCTRNCDMCKQAYRQFPCCTVQGKGRGDLPISKIGKVIEEITQSSLVNLNILGGDIFKYPDFKALTGMINHLNVRKTYHAHYLNIWEAGTLLRFLNPRHSRLKILAPFPVDTEKLKAACGIVSNNRIKYEVVFILQSSADFEEAEVLVPSLELEAYSYQPFYNGENLDFFVEGVFTGKEEILESKHEMKEIYANSAVNRSNFGRLTVLSNGHIHANVNAARLGILGKESMNDASYKEILHGRSWRRIRKHLEPCKGCVFECLCPPVSNYSSAIGRPDLCFNFSPDQAVNG